MQLLQKCTKDEQKLSSLLIFGTLLAASLMQRMMLVVTVNPSLGHVSVYICGSVCFFCVVQCIRASPGQSRRVCSAVPTMVYLLMFLVKWLQLNFFLFFFCPLIWRRHTLMLSAYKFSSFGSINRDVSQGRLIQFKLFWNKTFVNISTMVNHCCSYSLMILQSLNKLIHH